MTEKELLTGLLGKTLNLTADEVAALYEKVDDKEVLKANALDTLLEKDKGKVARLKEEQKTFFDNGYKKAQAETLGKFEKDIKEKFGVTDDKQGLELIELVVAEKAKSSGVELDDEKIKKSSLYLQTVDRLQKEKTEAVKAETKKFEDLQNSIQKETVFKQISEKALAIIDELNPILPEGKTADGKSKADENKQRLLRELTSEFGFEIKDGKVIVLKDGKVFEDGHSNMVDFKEIVKQKAGNYWDFKTGERRQGTGNNNDNNDGSGQSGAGYKGPIPKNEEEYMKFLTELKDEKAQIELTKAWTGSQTKV